jgi:predicted short-subunit dehydrogenase-like oxidoreductase (DUF2520 family)
MKIVIIGTGNAATVLGRKFRSAGHKIIQVFGRNGNAASKLAYQLDTESTTYWSVLRKDAELYLIAVSDAAIEEVASHFKLPDAVVVHTAASVSKEVLKKASSHYGVLYPLQTLKKENDVPGDLPLFIDYSDEFTRIKLEELASEVSRGQFSKADDLQRQKLHVAAVVAGNFTNHLYELAEKYCRKEGLDFKQLIPLIIETAERIKLASPSELQTGPAIRGDKETIRHHLDLIGDFPQLKKIYEVMTESIEKERKDL